MSTDIELKSQKLQTYAKVGGVAVVAVAASTIVAAAATSVAVAGVMAIGALFVVNFAVPVAARSFALWRVSLLTKLTETFSEETIREDEEKEAQRIVVLEEQYKTTRAELEGAQEEIQKQMKQATREEEVMLRAQVDAMQEVITNAEEVILQRKKDFKELQRVNKIYVALHRAGSAMQKAQGAERSTQQMQDIEIARNSIKTKMREAMAGKTIEAMNLANKTTTSVVDISVRRQA